MTKKPVRRNLGRGLSTLLADVDMSSDRSNIRRSQGNSTVPIERLHPNPDQPRRDFSEAHLEDLANSIREKGIIQPLIVRPDPKNTDEYQIVAGERRWRAAQVAQLHDIPVIIRELDDTEVLELGIIENIQRSDLNAVEEALGYRQLMDRFGHTQEKLATALGKSRSHIANLLRLLSLPDEVLKYLREGKLSYGHARALVPATNPSALARTVISKSLNVRQTEQLAKSDGTQLSKKRQLRPTKDADTRAIETDLQAHLRLKVSIDHRQNSGKGELRISYTSLDELDGLCQLLSR
ncbi:MAG: ParB/RepB/Spo0J family partition protein [Rhodobacteraceae bacterium]|nr:ParB/RepB/Spo0J family partition protein [Paracoccaceae bacterium]